MHLLMCAIHSCFSVAVAANTAKDFPLKVERVKVDEVEEVEEVKEVEEVEEQCGHLVQMSQPFLNCPSSSRDLSLTSSRGIRCCLLYFFLLITMFPYTSRSLNRKNCLDLFK